MPKMTCPNAYLLITFQLSEAMRRSMENTLTHKWLWQAGLKCLKSLKYLKNNPITMKRRCELL